VDLIFNRNSFGFCWVRIASTCVRLETGYSAPSGQYDEKAH